MAVNLSPYGGVGAQFLDNAGNVLTGGKIFTYAAGTTTNQATYTDSTGVTFHPNPIILDASGRVPSGGEIWLTDGLLYKFVLETSTGVLIATYDNIAGINSNFVNFTAEQEIQTATAGQTVFNLTTVNYTPGTNSLSVFVDGVNQYGPGAQYAYLETNSTTVTFVNGLHVGASVKFTTAAALTGTATNANVVIYDPAGTGAVQTTVQAKLRESVSVKDFGAVGDGIADDTVAIQNAVAATNTSGQWLFWNKGTYRITSGLSFTLPKMQWKSEEAVIFVDTPSDILRGIAATLTAGVNHQLVGTGFELNANGKCHSGIQFLQPLGTQTTSLYLQKVGVKNVEMQVGVGEGSHGLSVRGGFSQVKLIDCYAENIMMRTGAGILGTRGVTGIILQNNFGTSGAYIKNMILVRPTINRVYSQDATYQFDMDGIGLFANPADNTNGPAYAEVTSSDISGCWGRDIKMQTSACKVDSPKSLLNDGPTGGINNPTYDFQTGSGLVIGGQYTVDGVSNINAIVAFQISTDGAPMSSRWDGGSVDIINGGAVIRVCATDSIGVVTKFVAIVSNINVNGAVQNFAQIRTNGFDIHTLKLDGIVCTSITEALVRVIAGSGGSAPYRGILYTKNCINLGADIPTVLCNVIGNAAGVLLDDIGGIGFGPASVTYTGNATTISGLSIDNSAQFPIPLNSAVNSGTEKLYSFSLAASAEITLPVHGFNNNYLAQLIIGTSRTGFAVLSVDGTGIVSIDVGAGANIGTTSDPGSGDLRIWRLAGTNQLVVKNGTAANRVFLVKFFG